MSAADYESPELDDEQLQQQQAELERQHDHAHGLPHSNAHAGRATLESQFSHPPSAPLSYRKPQINTNISVAPRYLDPRKPSTTPIFAPEAKKFPPNPAFSNIPSRYAHPKPQEAPPKPRDVKAPLEGWSDLAAHRRLAAQLGFGSAQPKYPEAYQKADRSQSPVSPRRLVEHSKIERKDELDWRSTFSRKERTFDELAKESPSKLRPATSPRKASAVSPVMEYIRNGTPIKHTSTLNSAPASRSNSPRTRSTSPSQGVWHSAGGGQPTFEAIRKTASKHRAYQKEEARVREERERLATATRDKNFVPRVASLAIAYQIPSIDEKWEDYAAPPPPAEATAAPPPE